MANNNSHFSQRYVTAAWVAVSGSVTWLALSVTSLHGPVSDLGMLAELRIVTVSAGLAGMLTAPLFGVRPSLALVGAMLSTAFGAALAATALAFITFGQPGDALIGVIFGPMTVFSGLVTSPATGGVWVLSMLVVQSVAQQVNARAVAN